MARRLSALVIAMVCAATAAALDGSNAINNAAAFGWRGYADTDLQFSEFYGSNHTLSVRFMLQYPNAYTGPILSVDGSGAFFVAKAFNQSRLQVNLGGSVQFLDAPNPVQAGVWYHLTLVRNNDSFTFYLNGNQICQACAVPAGSAPPSGTLRFARLANGATDNDHETQHYGFVDDVAIFKRALTAAEIMNLAVGPRLTGGETDLYAGYTFDATTPDGGALPPALSRPVSFLTVTPGAQFPGLPAYTEVVSEDRNNAAEAALLPPPFQQAVMRLPFPAGEAWEVVQGWDDPTISHSGPASFAWDFILAGLPQSATNGKPIYAAARGPVVETRNDRDSCSGYPASYVMVEHAPVEIGAYLHFVKGSVAVADTQVVSAGDFLANAGDTGNTSCGAYHLHYALHTLPESQAAVLVTFPSAFNNYEVSTDLGASWQKVVRGIPKDGEWVRALANNSPVCDANGPYVAECAGPTTSVTLDGTGSSDPDGDPLVFTWTGPFAGGTATGASPVATFTGTGTSTVNLQVDDGLATNSCTAPVSIVDTIAPIVTCGTAISTLDPTNHELINVGLSTSSSDVCAGSPPVTLSVFADEDDASLGSGNASPDAVDVAAGTLRLRAERAGSGDGRVYLIVAKTDDGSGNTAHDCCTVTVPHGTSSENVALANVQATAARSSCLANGAAPSSFFLVGNGPVSGPKQ
jgi:murein DD-endopeptidase MepM/ murein hydrolase activator NlpD